MPCTIRKKHLGFSVKEASGAQTTSTYGHFGTDKRVCIRGTFVAGNFVTGVRVQGEKCATSASSYGTYVEIYAGFHVMCLRTEEINLSCPVKHPRDYR